MTAPASTTTAPANRLAIWARPTTNAAASQAGYDLGLLLLRVGVGLTLAAHGTQKLFGWFGGFGLDGTGQFFTMSGYPAGKAMAVVAGLSETLGGLGLVLGLLTPLAAAAALGTMINALSVKWGGGFFAPKGVEYELMMVGVTAALAVTGPGRFSADRFLPRLRAHRLSYGAAALTLGVVVAGVVLLFKD